MPNEFSAWIFLRPETILKKYCSLIEQSAQGVIRRADRTRDKPYKKYGNGPILLGEKNVGGQKNPLDKLLGLSILRARLYGRAIPIFG